MPVPVVAAMQAAQMGQTVVEHAPELATVGFGGVSRILQAIVIFLCVIIILIGIIVMRVGSFVTGLIWFTIGAVAMGGTIYWIHGNQSFYRDKTPVAAARPRQMYRPRRIIGRGEELNTKSTLDQDEQNEVKIVGADDCGCGGADIPTDSDDDDNIIPINLTPRPIKGAGEAGELFEETMLKDNARPDLPKTKAPLVLRA